MAQYVPPDRPAGVHPPGSEGWEGTAVTWLLELVPEYRQYTMVCRHPVILASIARHLIHGSGDGARDGYRTVRTDLAEHAPPHAVVRGDLGSGSSSGDDSVVVTGREVDPRPHFVGPGDNLTVVCLGAEGQRGLARGLGSVAAAGVVLDASDQQSDPSR